MSNGNRKGPMGGGRGPGGPAGGAVEKAKDFRGTMKKLMEYLRPYRSAMILVIIFAFGSAAFAIVGPKIVGEVTTSIFEGLMSGFSGETGGGIDFTYIRNTLLMLLGLYVVSMTFSFIQGYVVSGVAQKVSYNMRKDISEKMNRMPLRYFDSKTHGEVLSRVTNDIDTLSQSLNQSLSQIITSVTTIIGILVMMISISIPMTIGALLILPISMILISLIVKNSQKFFKEQQEFLGNVNGQVEEMYSGHNIVKAFNREGIAREEFEKLNDTLYDSAWKSQFLSGIMMPMMNFIGNLGYVLVVILGGWLTVKNYIEVGDIVSFTQYIRNFTQQLGQTAQIANVLQSTAAASERVFEFLNEEEESAEPQTPASIKEVEGKVDFKNVNFGYNPEKTIINNFTATIKPGQRVAIVGPTGAGKTTIVKLLMRFYDINGGGIFIDGTDIKEFNRGDLRRAFGMVLQDTWLFNGSIMENIRYGKLNASDEEVMKAAKAAHAHRFIKTLPDGYNMELNEESSNISQGQKQLLTIARAILADPKMLILDEATSSVDTRTEVLIQKAMDNLMHGRTSFIIAHRLSTIKDADLILVMKDGDIIEQGNHEELLAREGFYCNLYNSQFEQVEA